MYISFNLLFLLDKHNPNIEVLFAVCFKPCKKRSKDVEECNLLRLDQR